MVRNLLLLCGCLVVPTTYGFAEQSDDYTATLSSIPSTVGGINAQADVINSLCRVKKSCEPRDYSGISGQFREWSDKLVRKDINVCKTPRTVVCETVDTSWRPYHAVPPLAALSEWYNKRHNTTGTLCMPSDWLRFDEKCRGGNNQRCYNGTFDVIDRDGNKKSFYIAKQRSSFDEECISEPLFAFSAYIYPDIRVELYEKDGSVRVAINFPGNERIPYDDITKPFYRGNYDALAVFPSPDFKITKYEIRVRCFCSKIYDNPFCALPEAGPQGADKWLEMNGSGSASYKNLHLKVHEPLPDCRKNKNK